MGFAGVSPRFDTNSTIPLWIGGEQVTTSLTYDVVSPYTDKTLYRAAAATESDVHAAVAAAEKALPGWAETGASERRDIILRAADELVKRKDEMWNFCKTETGSTEPYFAFDFSDSLEALRSTAGLIGSVQGIVPQILDKSRSAMLLQEPYGVVASISPWNCGTILSMRAFLGPIASEFDPSRSIVQILIWWQWATLSSQRHRRGPLAACGFWRTYFTALVFLQES